MPLPAATTRSPDGILCQAPLYVVLKHPSRWRSDPWRLIFGRWVVARALGVGRWVMALGARQGRPRGVRSTTRSLCRGFNGWLRGPGRGHHSGIVVVAIGSL